ncbi:hypothetical protein H4219_000562 [Mycoemilia scoparia]|uniref:GATA-type domain-containing protein n=1 Tax=Mycoemilia scoparia TaxID=417184 RepID=A0A9W8A386_9FUNG|nr:hypothetical protein H4219_000562 [Mycoemilia scoparia]
MNSHTIESPMAHFNDDTSAYFRAVAAVAAVATSSACGSQILSNPALPTRSYSAPRTPSGGRSLNTATNGLDRSAAAAAGYIDGQPTDGSFIHAPTPLNRVNLDSLLGFISPPPPKVLNDVFFSPAHNESPNLYPFPVAPKYTKSQATTGYCSPTDTFLEPDYLDITSPSSELTIFDEATKNFAPTPESMAFWSSDESDSVAGSEFSTRLPSPAPSLVTEGVCGSISYKSTPDMTISPVDLTINGINDEKRSTPPLTDPLSESDASTKCDDIVEQTNDSRESLKPTIFEQLTGSGVDWCRYCGTTEGINWRPGPWGKRTLCK